MRTTVRGFTLVELVLVVIILGILASVGGVRYLTNIEKSRRAEAKMILGQIRTMQEAYRLEWNKYAGKTNQSKLALEGVPWDSCSTAKTHYFSYTANTTDADADTFTATASRCTTNSKLPNVATCYTVTLTHTGDLTEGESCN